MKICRRCNVAFEDNSHFCPQCGQKLSEHVAVNPQKTPIFSVEDEEDEDEDEDENVDSEILNPTKSIVKTAVSVLISIVAALIWTAAGDSSGFLVVIPLFIIALGFVISDPEKYAAIGLDSIAFGLSCVALVFSILFFIL